MSIRVATFNVENLFSRPHVMNLPDRKESQAILDDHAAMMRLLGQEQYSRKDKVTILGLLEKYGLGKAMQNNEYLELRVFRGQLLKRPKGKPVEVVARGCRDWMGWVELKKEAITDEAVQNTARVIADASPDIIVTVEVESRPALLRFHELVLKPLLVKGGHEPYGHIMVIDGNDFRGIDVGIMSRFPITCMVSHVDDRTNGKPTFKRDCPEYTIGLDDGTELVIVPNHLSSKGSDPKGNLRRIQSREVKKIYEKLCRTHKRVIVAGDLNDHPAGGSLDALLKETDLEDAMLLDAYKGEFPGTYQHANASQKIDYLLLSPDLAQRVSAVDLNRRGFYAPTKWESYENINKETKDRFQASDHHCLFADIDL